ncbi:MAG: PD-(D/E)XK nuclease family protein [Candidatus Poseidonia sp.]|nr:PD-(D/E)XK nuclease family protein [Poseidonia sp.]
MPPRGGPVGRSRGRLSASSLTTYLRCPRQWMLNYQAGMSGPIRPSQILGIVLEEAFCDLLMMHPPMVDGYSALQNWASTHLENLAQEAHAKGKVSWENALWKTEDDAWDDVRVEDMQQRLSDGLTLYLEEVKACFEAQGGPFLEEMRTGNDPFPVPSPALGGTPKFPHPDKVPDVEKRSWVSDQHAQWQRNGAPIAWNEAWECARPWFKDPRVHQPQRLYHPDGWASGELDLVLRWDGNIRIIDIKSGRPSSLFASSLEHQLRFYAWLWHETHEGELVTGMEGWYLNGGERVAYPVPNHEEVAELTEFYRVTHDSMQSMAEGVLAFPASEDDACNGQSAGCSWCSVSQSGGVLKHPENLSWLSEMPQVSIKSPYIHLGEIQGRVSVKGRLTGTWGPMSNHFGEAVLGAVLVVGSQHITLEESEPGAFSDLHAWAEQEVILHEALPGVWRDQPRLYLDQRSTVFTQDDPKVQNVDISFTRLGLLRTRANVHGHVLCIRQREGTRIDGKPWSMVSFMLWDGSHIAEVVAFGSSISQRLLNLRPGDSVSMTGAELGWRSGVLQLRIDNRKTRLETTSFQ